MAERLNPLTLPLHGSQLIEASAGTGKTWTIAALYLRLILGHGRPRPLLPGEILVMTFTKAATRELAARVRERLVQAARRFRGEPAKDSEPDDDFLTSLLEAHPEGPPRQQAAWRLGLAAEAMDEAAIHTIDAWCQRMLREHAFDSGSLFDEELQANEAALLAQALRDHWRQQVYPLSVDDLDTVLALWKDVDALAKSVQGLVQHPLPAGAGQGSAAAVLQRVAAERALALTGLKQGWPARADEMRDWLTAVWEASGTATRKNLPRKGDAARWLQAIKDWALDSAAEQPALTDTARKRLPHAAIAAAFDVHAGVAIPSGFAQLDALLLALAALPHAGSALRLHAAARVQERLTELKAQSGHFGFVDLPNRLDAALAQGPNGENNGNAQRLRERIVAQYPVALIDEFQDTSPVQLRIFDRLYRIADNEPSRALLLIGDPKQAIYGFRGADIYSYLFARQATRGRHHALGQNFRSTAALVEAVNHVFDAAEERAGPGAFLFRDEAQAGESALPFVRVAAQGRKEQLVCAAGSVPALTWVVDEGLRNADSGKRLFAAHCAERITTLLNDAQAGFAGGTEAFKRLRPADIAILVNNGKEADAVRQALRARGVASVYLSDKDTVFQTPEAADLLRLLQAVAAPRDARLARAALATPLLGLGLPALLALAHDDEAFDAQVAVLEQLHGVWKTQGALALVRRALHAFALPARWLATDERRLTNALHLAELLQNASTQVPGEQALIRWLAQQIQDSEEGLNRSDDVILRLESDAELVQVVTVHKSKGLEYPLVFLPFSALVRDDSKDYGANAAFWLPGQETETDEPAAPHLILVATPALKAQKRLEVLRESTRLLYVALTRAQHALWVGLAGLQPGNRKTPSWQRSAVGALISGPVASALDTRWADVRALAAGCAGMVVQTLQDAADQRPAAAAAAAVAEGEASWPAPSITALAARQAPPPLAPARPYAAQFDRSWAISSYTALVRDAAWEPGEALAWSNRVWRDDEARLAAEAYSAGDAGAAEDAGAAADEGPAAVSLGTASAPWHQFPRGALAGNFLHDQLEWLAGEGFALEGHPALQQALQRRCERQGWGHRAPEVLAWLQRLCATPLPALAPRGASLAQLNALAPELEFWFPSDGLSAHQVDALCRQHLLPGQPRPALPERHLKGLLMGFADLVFEHGGRYWVLDYKSNVLGPRDADYHPQALEQAVLGHRYDVQAALYLFALHRLLKSRLGAAYAPEQHLGGAIYWFLRGVGHAQAGCCHLQPPWALLAELDAAINNGSSA
jgi:exodeoxyribonuclease V beta subunit